MMGGAGQMQQMQMMQQQQAGAAPLPAAMAREPGFEPVVQGEIAAPDIAEQIKKLSDLHAQGILSDADFEKAKAKILD